MRLTMGRQTDASDVADEQRELLEVLIPVAPTESHRPRYERA